MTASVIRESPNSTKREVGKETLRHILVANVRCTTKIAKNVTTIITDASTCWSTSVPHPYWHRGKERGRARRPAPTDTPMWVVHQQGGHGDPPLLDPVLARDDEDVYRAAV